MHITPQGNLADKLVYLKAKMTRIGVGFQQAIFSAEELYKVYFTVYIPRLSYSLQETHFTEAELGAVQAKFMSRFLNALHYLSKFPRAIVYAPMVVGGVGLLKLLYKQGAIQVKTIIGLL